MEYEEKVSLLKLYSDAVRGSVMWLVKKFQVNDYSEFLHNPNIPKRGKKKGSTYLFHGLGCRIKKDGITIDWDFYPKENGFIFDLWKINNFLKSADKKIDFSIDEMNLLVKDEVLIRRENQFSKNIQYIFLL